MLCRIGGTRGDNYLGNYDANWRTRATGLFLRRDVWFFNPPSLQRFIMFQIIFNELSAAEMSALPKTLQLDLLAEFQILPEDLDRLDSSRFGLLERDGKRLYRYRAKDYRIYFEKTPEGITVHRVLHKNTLRDFLFRTKLPTGEDEQLKERREFWNLIEQGERTRKKI